MIAGKAVAQSDTESDHGDAAQASTADSGVRFGKNANVVGSIFEAVYEYLNVFGHFVVCFSLPIIGLL